MAHEYDVLVREVGLRDGLQSLKTILPTALKRRWIRAEFDAGVKEIEVGSFVKPSLLPQLADTADLVESSLELPGLCVSVLVPNLKGAQRAVEVHAHKINCIVSVSEGHSLSNVRRPTAEAIEEFGRIVDSCKGLPEKERPIISIGLATSFGCTIDGVIPERRVRAIASEVVRIGADEIVLADTVGYGNPKAVTRLCKQVRSDVGPYVTIAAHFHDTRGTGLANVVAALDAGIVEFDASLGGLGGCPYAPGATGNIVTEDLVYMLESMGLRTTIDLSRLIELRREVETFLPMERFEGALARAGVPKNYQQPLN